MIQHYILKHRKPVPVPMLVWAYWFEKPHSKRIRLTYLGDIRISTVFLGLDHGLPDIENPILFETMIFGLFKDDEYQTRCTHHRQALQMHKTAVQIAKDHYGKR